MQSHGVVSVCAVPKVPRSSQARCGKGEGLRRVVGVPVMNLNNVSRAFILLKFKK